MDESKGVVGRKSPRLAAKTSFSKFVNTVADPIEIDMSEGPSKLKLTGAPRPKRKLDDDDFEEVVGMMDKDASRRFGPNNSQIVLVKEKNKRKKCIARKSGKKACRNRGEQGSNSSDSKRSKKEIIVKQWPPVVTRSSPHQLCRVLSRLNDKQKVRVKEIGFGKMLDFKMDGLPGKLCHFVVDKLDTDKMELDLGVHKIKVDTESIHKLFGIPKSGLVMNAENKPKDKDAKCEAWKQRNGKRSVSPKEIADRILAEGDDGEFFKIDFIVLFCATMIDCHRNGLCKFGVLDYKSEHNDFGDINFCNYILESVRKCKNGWVRADSTSTFIGPLTILTLLYVDSVKCPGMSLKGTGYPISYWTFDKLRKREVYELKKGGFGMGEVIAVFVDEDVNNNVVGDKEHADDVNQDKGTGTSNTSNEQDDFVKIHDIIKRNLEQKATLEMAIADVFKRGDDDIQVAEVINMYKSLYVECVEFTRNEEQEHHLEEQFKTPPQKMGENDDGMNWTQYWFETGSQISRLADEKYELAMSGARRLDELNEVHIPYNFSLGLTQDLNNNGEVDDVGDVTAETNKGSIDEDMKGKRKLVGDDDMAGKIDECIMIRGKREKHVADVKRSPFYIRGVNVLAGISKEDRVVWAYVMDGLDEIKKRVEDAVKDFDGSREERDKKKKETKEQFEVEVTRNEYIFGVGNGLMAYRYLFFSLEFGEKLYASIIDCWAATLNYDERFRNINSPNRLFGYTTLFPQWVMHGPNSNPESRLEHFRTSLLTVVGNDQTKANLKNYDIVLFPVYDQGHFFVVCAELKHPSIYVIDNMHEEETALGVVDDSDFFVKDAPLKVKDIFVSYLKLIRHAKWREMEAVEPLKIVIDWATKGNYYDCGLYVMRHMETYNGSWVNKFDAGFNNGKKREITINALRQKYVAKMLLSDVNIYRAKVIEGAKQLMKNKLK